MFLNSDEEIGSRESQRYIERLAPLMESVLVLVLEPALNLLDRRTYPELTELLKDALDL